MWTLIDRLVDVYRDISDIVYVFDVLVVIVYISHCNCWTIIYCWTRIEASVLRAGRGRGVGGGEGWGLEVRKKNRKQNVPGVLKRKINWGGGGGEKCLSFFPYNFCFKKCSGVLKRAGSENDTLLPMTMTCDRLKFWTVRLGGQKLSSGNLGGGRIYKKNVDKTIRPNSTEGHWYIGHQDLKISATKSNQCNYKDWRWATLGSRRAVVMMKGIERITWNYCYDILWCHVFIMICCFNHR